MVPNYIPTMSTSVPSQTNSSENHISVHTILTVVRSLHISVRPMPKKGIWNIHQIPLLSDLLHWGGFYFLSLSEGLFSFFHCVQTAKMISLIISRYYLMALHALVRNVLATVLLSRLLAVLLRRWKWIGTGTTPF